MDNWQKSFTPAIDHHLDSQFDDDRFNLPHQDISNLDDNFLHQLEDNLYQSNQLLGNIQDSINELAHTVHRSISDVQSDLSFIIPDDINIDQVYPPASIPENTPLLLPNNKNNNDHKRFVSPILSSQNEKSYNDEHLYRKKQQQPQAPSDGQHPNMTESAASQSSHQPQSHVQPQMVFTPLVSPAVTPMEKYQPPTAASFEPLTSPALHAADRLRSSSSMYGPGEDQASSSYKRRTPHGTPTLMAQNQGGTQSNSTKPSPSLKGRTSASFKVNNVSFERLSEASATSENLGNGGSSMLPPRGKSTDEQPPLMGFTMGRLAEENTRPRSTRKQSISASSSATSSPNIIAKAIGEKKGIEKPSTKKASHKLAEQGRRNRMNMAVQELGTLIPQDYHDEIAIPSKATTVELASKYIRALKREIEELKGNS
jgi:phosphate system positive regulatory protein PHO4